MANTDTFLLVICIIMGVMALLQIGFLIALAVMGGKALKMAKEYADDLRTTCTPTLNHARDLVETSKNLLNRLEPRLDAAASDLAEIVKAVREETRNIQASADEINERIRRQAERMDQMTTATLNGMETVGHFMNVAMNAPMRQVSGIIAAVRAIVETLRAPAPRRTRTVGSAQADD